ncbi:MAG: tetratricopeptide repeat protein [Rhodospirillales bacterium]|nr:tetratricopeptide repeat protein [Rhodospirillales bacterium]
MISPPLPVHAEAMALMGEERWGEAGRLLEDAGEEARAHPLGLFLLGACRCQLGDPDRGIALLEQAAGQEPDHPQIRFALAKAYLDGARYDLAEAGFRRCLDLDPGNADAHAHLGLALKELVRFEDAKAAIRQAIALDPANAKWHVNLGLILTEQDKMAEAEASFRHALALDPANANAHTNLGLVLQYTDRLAEGEAVFRQALALAEAQPKAYGGAIYQYKGNLALNQLERGRLEEGFALFEARIEGPAWTKLRRDADFPTWDGSPLAGRRLLIWREQGLGDEIRAFSCLPDLMAREPGQAIAVECDPRLGEAMARSFPSFDIIAGRADRSRLFDCQIAMSSLVRPLRPRLESFAAAQPFLIPDPVRIAKWRQRLAALPQGKKIGICWRTGLVGANRLWNISMLEMWQDVLTLPGAQFVSLQYGQGEDELRSVELRLGIAIHRWRDLDLKNDLDDLLALMAGLDLVLTVGTAVNDLAGAVGTPAWVILRTPHQDMLGTERYPWYPSARVFGRAWNRPWPDMMGEVAAELKHWRVSDLPRNAPCPCGSGLRVKQCCGR